MIKNQNSHKDHIMMSTIGMMLCNNSLIVLYLIWLMRERG
jgi:hypothetical protein